MNHTEATRPIKQGSRWTNGEHEVTITKVTKREVEWKTTEGGWGLADIWWFRENYAPAARKGAAT